jgi:Flp pilus assembly protein TadD
MPSIPARLAALTALACGALGAGECAAGPRPERPLAQEARPEPPDRNVSAAAIAHYLEGTRLLRDGDPSGAAHALGLAIMHDPASPELRVERAEALALVGSEASLAEADAEARRAVELGRDGPAASDAQVLLARVAAGRGRLDAAAAALAEAVRIERGIAARGAETDRGPWLALAELEARRGDDDAAARVLEDLAATLPPDGTGFRELGRTMLRRKQPARAERHLRRARQLSPRDAEVLRLLAAAHEALGRAADAREDHLEIVRLDPDDAPSLGALGRAAAQAGDVERAREWLARAVRASGGTADAHVAAAFAWMQAALPDEALRAARRGIAAAGPDPRLRLAEGVALSMLRRPAEAIAPLEAVPPEAGEVYLRARVALADALSRTGRHARAGRALAQPLATHPADVRVVVARGRVLEREGRRPQAIAWLRAARDARGGAPADVAELTVALGAVLLRAGRADEARALLEGAVVAEPGDTRLLYALAVACDRAGQPEAALAQLRAILALEEDHAEALNFAGYLLADRGERLDEAERLVRRAAELRPRSAHVLDSLGWLLLRRGDAAGAVRALERADALGGPDPTVLEHLGDAYRAAARDGDARRAYRRALGARDEEDAPRDRQRRRAALERKLRGVRAGAAPASAP